MIENHLSGINFKVELFNRNLKFKLKFKSCNIYRRLVYCTDSVSGDCDENDDSYEVENKAEKSY